MSKNSLYEIEITSLSHDGRGIGHLQGKAVFIDGCLPGETVLFRYQKKRGKFDEGKLEQIMKSSSLRTTPVCQHFGMCGGCDLQHLPHQEQIIHKEKLLRDHLQHFGRLEPKIWLSPMIDETLNYRHKARLSVKYVAKKNTALVGFREKQAHFVADLEYCPILAKPVAHLITPLKQLINQLTIPDAIPQIEVAVGENQAALTFRHLKPMTPIDLKYLTEFSQQHQVTVFLQPEGYDSVEHLAPENAAPYIQYTLPDFDLTFSFKPSQFSQVNPGINRKMVALAIEKLQLCESDLVLDLFCGFGNFTLPIAKFAKKVYGIEGSAEAITQARLNAEWNQIHNAEFHAFDLCQPLESQAWSKLAFDKVLLDPPRSGAENLMPWLLNRLPVRIVYISCNPATLARDLGILTQTGRYQLLEAGIMDMFPHTKHVESVAVLERKPK